MKRKIKKPRQQKRQQTLFFRTVYITSVILFCLFIAFYGIAKAYENIRLIGFGEYRSAVELGDGEFSFFDFSFYY